MHPLNPTITVLFKVWHPLVIAFFCFMEKISFSHMGLKWHKRIELNYPFKHPPQAWFAIKLLILCKNVLQDLQHYWAKGNLGAFAVLISNKRVLPKADSKWPVCVWPSLSVSLPCSVDTQGRPTAAKRPPQTTKVCLPLHSTLTFTVKH